MTKQTKKDNSKNNTIQMAVTESNVFFYLAWICITYVLFRLPYLLTTSYPAILFWDYRLVNGKPSWVPRWWLWRILLFICFLSIAFAMALVHVRDGTLVDLPWHFGIFVVYCLIVGLWEYVVFGIQTPKVVIVYLIVLLLLSIGMWLDFWLVVGDALAGALFAVPILMCIFSIVVYGLIASCVRCWRTEMFVPVAYVPPRKCDMGFSWPMDGFFSEINIPSDAVFDVQTPDMSMMEDESSSLIRANMYRQPTQSEPVINHTPPNGNIGFNLILASPPPSNGKAHAY